MHGGSGGVGHVALQLANHMVELDLTIAHFKGLSLHVVFMLIPMLHNHRREDHAVILKARKTIAEVGDLKPVIDETSFSLADVSKAHERLVSGKAMGKVVIDV